MTLCQTIEQSSQSKYQREQGSVTEGGDFLRV